RRFFCGLASGGAEAHRLCGGGWLSFPPDSEVLAMSPHAPTGRPPRSLLRSFQPSRLARTTLAQAYELLLPDPRRPLPRPVPPEVRGGESSSRQPCAALG